MKLIFENAYVELVELNISDIITTSIGDNDGEIDWEG